MSAQTSLKRVTVRDVAACKGKDPLVVLTCYTAPMAQVLDEHVDMLLVGDSLGMVVYGMDTTLGVTVDMMINHGQAVMRGSRKAMVIVDLPFGSYGESPAQAYRNAARILKETGAAAVKLEGGAEMAETVRFLTQRGVPVMGHVGLKPQMVHATGGFRAQGRTEAEAKQILADAKAIAEAGAFSLVVEGTWEGVAREVTEAVGCPTIGIGASATCDGQVLVTEDVMGLFSDFTPKFVKKYAQLNEQISEAAGKYAADVRARRFPGPEHCFGMPKLRDVKEG
ncbi:3-methyl-2-oxobutanoate hydroxymethyltransferase [Caenispirillum salinarum AK4]|uniref:3-methyl-2-oxobutanoate hydroxymethyltransferase n=1 Tax=Caenispirillum salinarum AK4 TaxID=1238182 RepID=K9H5K0_9PROT|nr:3-methyl-2-oxobutanoate hydroxymethyltransferase [Caenispirillum salinarum]EKV32374.1 3-methyl-2-oxobutanoate hydroxymethyltransferase [Caenispirillum salinarum AK4]